MKRVPTSLALFAKLRDTLQKGQTNGRIALSVSAGTCGRARGAMKVIAALQDEIDRRGIGDHVYVKATGCHGYCEAEPNIVVYPGNFFYAHVKPEDAGEFIEQTVLNGRAIERLQLRDPVTNKPVISESDVPFYRAQARTLLGGSSHMDPTSIEDYIATGGYSALAKALGEMRGADVIEEVIQAGLRGRGGAGFPTGHKWRFLKTAPGKEKYIICNADEGDPGAYMDRSLLEGNPHSVIEGMIIGAYAMGATGGFIYVRDEYPLAVKHVTMAVEQARECGLLGRNILGFGFDFDVQICRGAGAFVCGEETALIHSIEGSMGEPRQRPPFPVSRGVFGKPTNINNVETWANVPHIINRGAAWFASVGTDRSKGTKIFSLVGKIRNTGLVEVPMGMSLRDIVYDVGGGIPKNKKLKAVQTGGPSGGCIPLSMVDIPVDYEQLAEAGAMMGSGGMVVMDDDTCMVDIARYFLTFLQEESCGKCFSCRKGVQRMLEIVTDITQGRASMADLALLEELAEVVRDASMCGLGRTASNPVLSTLRHFREEYIDHIVHKRCRAGVCTEIVSSPCMHTCPVDQEASTYVAYIAYHEFAKAAEVICRDNPLPWVCSRACFHPCELKCRASLSGDAISVRALKRFALDWAYDHDVMPQPIAAPPDGERVAIIGSGPAGLSCAFYLTRQGRRATVFEAQPFTGGMAATGVPHHRLPPHVLQRDIDRIKAMGVEVKTGVHVGEDVTIDDLLAQGYKAVFIAVGTQDSMKLGLPNEDAQGVVDGLEILTAINLGHPVTAGSQAIVVGGGSVAVDTARALRRLSCKDIAIIYRRTRNEMPAYSEEIECALDEGIELQLLTAPVEIMTKGGRVTGVKCIKMELGPIDERGRRRPVPIPGSEYVIECDMLIPAIGEKANLDVLAGEHEYDVTRWGTVIADPETQTTNRPGVFAGGDVVSGPSTIVEAMSQGKKAAFAIARYLAGEDMTPMYRVTRPSVYLDPVDLTEDEIFNSVRPRMPLLPPDERIASFEEVELGLSEAAAVREARRCLRCDLEVKNRLGIDEAVAATVGRG